MTRHSAATIGALCVLLAVQACGGDGANERRASPGAAPTGATNDKVTNAGDLEARVEELGRVRYADRYAGLERVGGMLVVHRKPSSDLDRAVRSLAAGTPVEFRNARYSRQELDALRQRVEGDLDGWRSRGVNISSVGTATDGTAVEIGTPDVEHVRQEFAQRYGADAPLRVERMGPISILPR